MGADEVSLTAQLADEAVLNGDFDVVDALAAIADEVIVLLGSEIIAIGAIGDRDLLDETLSG